ncbi:MAG: hypothetical protein ACD_16C00250G0008 [uncultured bacterium]|nr:MAG: hypothetical protein ACD_16C00250G0008 [uncultured bacterium]OFW68555.1 MAG: hypothetical protein A2X70_02420 [Alphaproteobacteria bacterium GWC2_42_16]OFW73172.1 MAG: hypothetical protein A2Z80_01075 [Alphaproteobacteria bacterium GWA2_41_27]OFW81720.1 MAG: hypothetical protein A3E50_01990 [Alphaproteobacteria bacterium RIFCSPHIGHO2_12_FULL_42_100]OFW86436.1 MAG: hypothetical protein A2W06_05910 [Alphaproteobacteria bacterium RBG_16_42_14]OFW90620.1 MAG: hypothetical protein A3C41_004
MKKQKFTALCIALGLFLSTETLAQNSTDSIKQMSAEELAQSPAFMFLTLIGNLHDKGLLETSGDGDCKTIDMDFNEYCNVLGMPCCDGVKKSVPSACTGGCSGICNAFKKDMTYCNWATDIAIEACKYVPLVETNGEWDPSKCAVACECIQQSPCCKKP